MVAMAELSRGRTHYDLFKNGTFATYLRGDWRREKRSIRLVDDLLVFGDAKEATELCFAMGGACGTTEHCFAMEGATVKLADLSVTVENATMDSAQIWFKNVDQAGEWHNSLHAASRLHGELRSDLEASFVRSPDGSVARSRDGSVGARSRSSSQSRNSPVKNAELAVIRRVIRQQLKSSEMHQQALQAKLQACTQNTPRDVTGVGSDVKKLQTELENLRKEMETVKSTAAVETNSIKQNITKLEAEKAALQKQLAESEVPKTMSKGGAVTQSQKKLESEYEALRKELSEKDAAIQAQAKVHKEHLQEREQRHKILEAKHNEAAKIGEERDRLRAELQKQMDPEVAEAALNASADDMRKCLEAFNKIDSNHDGVITRAEWQAAQVKPSETKPFHSMKAEALPEDDTKKDHIKKDHIVPSVVVPSVANTSVNKEGNYGELAAPGARLVVAAANNLASKTSPANNLASKSSPLIQAHTPRTPMTPMTPLSQADPSGALRSRLSTGGGSVTPNDSLPHSMQLPTGYPRLGSPPAQFGGSTPSGSLQLPAGGSLQLPRSGSLQALAGGSLQVPNGGPLQAPAGSSPSTSLQGPPQIGNAIPAPAGQRYMQRMGGPGPAAGAQGAGMQLTGARPGVRPAGGASTPSLRMMSRA